MSEFYDERYRDDGLYWGNQPSSMARLLYQKFPPGGHDKLLEIGSGEGRDAIFFARKGYRVSAFDASAEGVKKAVAWARDEGVKIRFFQADINLFQPREMFDVIFSSGALHYIPLELREKVLSRFKRATAPGGIHAHLVPVQKPNFRPDPESDVLEQDWRSGEILEYYHDWKIEFFLEESVEDAKSGYMFPVNRLIAMEPAGNLE